MTSVLVVDDDAVLRRAVASELTKRGYDVSSAGSVDEGLGLMREAPFDVLVTDLRMGGKDGIDLLTAVRDHASATRTILMSGFATAKDYQHAIELGAVRVLCKPFTPDELIGAIEHAVDCETGFRGSIHGLSLIDIIQMFHYARRTITVTVTGARTAFIDIRDGEIVHAQHGEVTGTDALRHILGASSGAITTSVPNTEGPRTIEVPFQSLVLDVLRELDEEGRDEWEDAAFDGVDAGFDALTDDQESGAGAGGAHWEHLNAVLQQLAPDVGAMIVDVHTGAIVTLVGAQHTEGCDGAVATLLALASSLGGDCMSVEYVGEDVAFAAFTGVGGGELLLHTPLVGSLAAPRFRSLVRRIEASLSELGSTGERP
jgi:ActR/RegA family two-component response regulator